MTTSSPSSDTRPPVITEDQVRRIVAAMERNGATVNVADPRVSAVQTWIIGLVGVGAIAAGGWLAQSVATLNATLSKAITTLDQYGAILADHEQRLRQQERKP